ncbi:MAG: TonB-dependent receptor [Opitutaceae bacterium]|nr:TonB-dependent receptor [Opitutaceae bacterium]
MTHHDRCHRESVKRPFPNQKPIMRFRCTSTHCRAAAIYVGIAAIAISLSNAQPAEPEKAITLNPFVVTSQNDDTYRTDESNTATGIATKLVDIPLSISVINDIRMTEYAADSVDRILSKVPGVPTQTLFSNEIHVRGFPSTAYLNGDRFANTSYAGKEIEFLDRIEIVKGPNAVFYGLIQPGGVVNMVTKRPLPVDKTTVSFTVGSYQHTRSRIDINRTFLDNHLRVRVGAAYTDEEYYFESTNKRNKNLSAAIVYDLNRDISFDTTIIYNDAKRKYFQAAPRSLKGFLAQTGPVKENVMRTWRTANKVVPLFDTYAYSIAFPTLGIKGNTQGDGIGYYMSEDTTTFSNLVWRISSSFTNRFHYYTEKHEGEEIVAGQEPNLDGTATGGVGHTIWKPDGHGFKDELVHVYEGPSFKNRLLLGGEWNISASKNWSETGGAQTINLLAGERFTAARSAGLHTGDRSWISAVTGGFSESTVKGIYVADQLSLLKDDRLRMLLGARRTWISSDSGRVEANSGAITRTTVDRSASDTTFQTGAVYDIGDGVNLFASYSETFQPQTGAVSYDGKITPPASGLGYEAGVKFGEKKKIGGTISVYETEIDGIAHRDVVAEALRSGQGLTPAGPIYIQAGVQRVRGSELELSFNFTSEFQLYVGYSYIWFAAAVSDPTTPAAIGRRMHNTPKHAFNISPRYEIKSGRFKGLYLGSNIEYKGEHYAHPNNVLVPIINSSFTVVDLFGGYRTKIGEYPVVLRANVMNLLNKEYFNGRYTPGNPREFRLSIETTF